MYIPDILCRLAALIMSRRVDTWERDGWTLVLANNASGFECVTRPQGAAPDAKWQAKLTLRKGEKQTDLGSYEDPEDGAIAVAKARAALAADPEWRPKEKQGREAKGAKRARHGCCTARLLSSTPHSHICCFICTRRRESKEYPLKFQSESGMLEYLNLRNYSNYSVAEALAVTQDLPAGCMAWGRTAPPAGRPAEAAVAGATPLTVPGGAGPMSAFYPSAPMPMRPL